MPLFVYNPLEVKPKSTKYIFGPALMAIWSKALPLIASCLSHCPVSNPIRACEKVASDLGLGGGFCWVLQFPPPLTTG